MVANYYGNEFLDILESKVDIKHSMWLRNAVSDAAPAVHPLRNILLILFLAGDMNTFFQGNGQEYKPFGEGPWPCLNKVCVNYLKDTIDTYTVKTHHWTGRPVGTFACTCGHIYSRQGPDKTRRDRYRKGRIIDFGYVWREILKNILGENGKINYAKLARQLGCKDQTVKKHVEILTGKNAISNIPMSKYVPDPLLIQKYKNSWMNILKSNPEMKRSQLQKCFKKEYIFLYRYARKWLYDTLPLHRYVINHNNSNIDWNKRDNAILVKLQDAYIEMIHRNKPIRITKVSLGKSVGHELMIRADLNKLPRCKVFVDKVWESGQQFNLRKIVIKQMQGQGMSLNECRFLDKNITENEHYEWIKETIILIQTLMKNNDYQY